MSTYRTIFISHAHADNARCACIATHLKAKGVDLWIDLTNAQRGDDLGVEINDQLEQRSAFVLMVTTSSNASHWVRQERGAFNALMNDNTTRYINGVPRMMLSVRLSAEVPVILRGILWIDGVGKPDAQIAEEIAQAILLKDQTQQHDTLAIPTPTPPIQVSASAPSTPSAASQVPDTERPEDTNDSTPLMRHRRQTGIPLTEFRLPARNQHEGIADIREIERIGKMFEEIESGYALPSQPIVEAPTYTPASLVSDHFPERLARLGFVGQVINGVEVITPPLCEVSAGSFLMGSVPNIDTRAEDDEQPPHMVQLATYQIAQYPVTVAEYACYLRATGKSFPDWQSQMEKLDYPVTNISWQDASDYATWLARKTVKPWALPTEAEWEKAARGTNGRIFPWGDQWDKTRANTHEGGSGHTTPVGDYPNGESPYHVQDMAGNVWEWCNSLYKPYPYDLGREDNSRGKENIRVLRGGSWMYDLLLARTTSRWGSKQARNTQDYGFRLACWGSAQ